MSENQIQPAFNPFLQMMGVGPSYQQPVNEVPARVRVALEFLQSVTYKTMVKVAVNGISIEWQDGQKLTPTEIRAQMQAHSMLCDYFQGKMKADPWEKLHQAILRQDDKVGGSLLNCIACAGGPVKMGCKLCKGTGAIMVYPSVEGGR